MDSVTNFLTALGEHFYLILFVCFEIVFAIVLVGIISKKKNTIKTKGRSVGGAERILIDGLGKRANEACVVVRRKDTMPIYSLGDIESILGANLERIQEDSESLVYMLKNPEEGSAFLKKYRDWEGKGELCTEMQMQNGQWVATDIFRNDDDAYDIVFFKISTKEHKDKEEYQKHLDRAEAESQLKTSFLFRMSHEIRTPMNGITGMLTLAQAKLAPDHPAMQYLSKADELSEHLLALINDILDMSRIEAGKVELEKRPFSIKAFGSKLFDMFYKTLEAKGVRFSIIFEEMTVDWVVGDELRIGQVVINFLSNAVKFTSEGEVKLTFRQMMIKDGSVDLMIRVHDTGIGMKPEFVNRIFRPFEQEDASTTRRFGGTGLGMAISDQLVKLMGGQIVVDTMLGKGSDFTVFLTLPIAENVEFEASEQNEDKNDEPIGDVKKKCRILMAEDNDINAMIAVEILTQKGAEVDVEKNGRLVIDRFEKMPENYYDIILMDIQMPVMDGRTAARKIRALDRADAENIPIFALSADAFVEDERLSKESGMNGHFSKPIDFDRLWKTVSECLK